MYRNIKLRLGLWLCVIAVSALGIVGAIYLGNIYLEIIKQGGVPKSTKVNNSNSKSVVALEEQKTLLLNPIPVYYLQAGVYSDVPGAQEAAKPLADLGYMPYITQSTPYRIWLGVYQKRGDTEFIKQQLKDKGFGSFTASCVINGSNVRYSKGSELFIKEITPILETYTRWLKESLTLFHADNVARLNWDLIDGQRTVIDKVYKDVSNQNREIKTNNDAINQRFAVLYDTTAGYQNQLDLFCKQRDQKAFQTLQNELLRFVDNYLLLWQEIDNISKT